MTLLSIVAATSCILAAQQPDPITLTVGSPLIDGRPLLKSHLAAAVQTLTRDGLLVYTRRFTLDKYVEQRNGVPVFHLYLDAYPDGSDSTLRSETILDLRTMALVHREEDDGAGRTLVADVDGARITGTARASASAAPERIDVTLETPSFNASFIDAAINATDVREGQVFKVPAFGSAPAQQKTEWHTYRVAGRDTVSVRGRKVDAWIIEAGSHARYRQRRIWLMKEPPYFPLEITVLPDGSTLRFEQTLIRMHP